MTWIQGSGPRSATYHAHMFSLDHNSCRIDPNKMMLENLKKTPMSGTFLKGFSFFFLTSTVFENLTVDG